MKFYSVKNVSYEQKGKKIINNISFEVNKGDKIAIIGHNGSGKTTLQELLLGNIKQSEGSIVKCQEYFKIGIIYDSFSLFPLLKVNEIINFFIIIYKIKDTSYINYLIKELNLLKIQNSFLKSLSLGEKKKVIILLALADNPDVLIMDEPFSNIDPITVSIIIKNIFTKNRTVIYSTNNWDDIKDNDTKLILISKGSQIGNMISKIDLQKQIPSHNKIVVENLENIYSIIQNLQYYMKDNQIHIFSENLPLIMNKILEFTNNISILNTDIIDYYLLNTSKY